MIIMKKNINKFLIHIILLTLTMLLVIVSLNANFAIDNNTNGGIKEAISNANSGDMIILDQGNYTGTNNTGISINKSITLQGNGLTNTVIIDAQGLRRIFSTGSNNITFINITFANGNSSDGGGAIYNNNYVNITFINCAFTNNIARTYGGAIESNGNYFTVINSTFTNNTANNSQGGAIASLYNNNFTIINSTFTNNTAGVHGGAIMIFSVVNFTIINSTFTNNTAASFAGAILGMSGNGVRIINCTFINNTAITGSAGAIQNENIINLMIINSTFTNNSAISGWGGAINNHHDNFTLIDCTFINNTAYQSGGAIYTGNIINFTVINSNFSNNTAYWGGAIYIASNNSAIINSTFTNNTAEYRGGAIYNNANSTTVIDSNFMSNEAYQGGAVYNGLNMSVFRNIMTGNSATGLGNEIYNNGLIGILNLAYLNNSTVKTVKDNVVVIFAYLTDDMGNTITGQIITFIVNGTNVGNETSIEGYANLSYITSDFGLIPVTGNYTGSNGYSINILNGQLNITKLATNSSINVNNSNVNKPVSIVGVAVDEDSNPLVNVELDVVVDGQLFNVTTNNAGAWSLIYTPNHDGNFDISVTWTGNNTYTSFTNTSSFSVSKLATNSSINVNNSKVNKPVNIVGVVIDENGELLANIQITVIINGQLFNVTTDNAGAWSLIYTPNHSGNFDISVNWIGNDNYADFTNNTSFSVSKLATNSTINISGDIKLDETITISGNAYDENNNPLTNVKISVTVDGKVYSLKTDFSGFWSLKYKPTHTGEINIKVIFHGNEKYFGLVNNSSFNVKNNNNNNNNNHTNNTNHTNDDNSNDTSNYSSNTSMKKTGIPIISIILLLLSLIGISTWSKKQK